MRAIPSILPALFAVLVGLAPCAAVSGPVGDVLFDTLPPAVPTTDSWSMGIYARGQSFSSGPRDTALASVTLAMVTSDPASTGDNILFLALDDGGQLGPLLALFDLFDSAVTSTDTSNPSFVTISASDPGWATGSTFDLAADSFYWIGLVNDGPTAASWLGSNNASGIGVTGTRYFYAPDSGTFVYGDSDSDGTYQMRVEQVPEIGPAGWAAVAALALGCLCLVKPRRPTAA